MPLHEVLSYVAIGLVAAILVAGILVVRNLYQQLHCRVSVNEEALERRRELLDEVQHRLESHHHINHSTRALVDELVTLVREDLMLKHS